MNLSNTKFGRLEAQVKKQQSWQKQSETKQHQLPPDNDFFNHIMVIVCDIINIEKATLSLREKAMTK